MKLCIDSANVEEIQRLYSIYNIDGVSTNPTILAKAGLAPYEVLHQIRKIVGDDGLLFVQALGEDVGTIQAEAQKICSELGDNTIIKIPATEMGLAAIKHLSKTYHVLATAIYSAQQAFLAAKNGAEWMAPYVNRISRFGGNGIEETQCIQDIIENNNFNSKILAASFHEVDEVVELARYGVEALTISPDIFKMLIANDKVDEAVKDFKNDFAGLTSAEKNMANL